MINYVAHWHPKGCKVSTIIGVFPEEVEPALDTVTHFADMKAKAGTPCEPDSLYIMKVERTETEVYRQ